MRDRLNPNLTGAPGGVAVQRQYSMIFDTGFTFGIFAVLLFVPQLKSLTPVIAAGLVLLCLFWKRLAIPDLVRHGGALLLIPIFALLSRLWSINPDATGYYGVQFLITCLAGLLIGITVERRAAINGIFLAFAVYTVGSLIFGKSVTWGGGALGHSAFAGLAQGKNTAGDTAAVGAIFSMVVLLATLEKRRLLGASAAAAILVLQVYIVAAAHSSGALLGLAIALPMILLWNGSRLMAISTRLMIAIGGILAMVLAMATRTIWLPPLTRDVMTAMGKDSTLTGRTYLWDRAQMLIEQRPMLGLGYNAFWRHGNLDAEGLWRNAAIASRSGFNFHNSAIEILVHLGYVGLILLALVFLGYLAVLLGRTISTPDLPLIGWAALLLYEMSRMPFESLGTGTFHYTTVLLAAGLTVALNRAGAIGQPIRLRLGLAPPAWRLRPSGGRG